MLKIILSGMKIHWLYTCHMPKYLIDFYQVLLAVRGNR